jgi:hypothetical protein
MRAFEAETEAAAAVSAFLQESLKQNTRSDCPPGCLIGTCAAAASETVPGVAERLAATRAVALDRVAARFELKVAAGELPSGFPSRDRAGLLLDVMQAQAARARAGEPRASIAADIPSRAAIILSPPPVQKDPP